MTSSLQRFRARIATGGVIAMLSFSFVTSQLFAQQPPPPPPPPPSSQNGALAGLTATELQRFNDGRNAFGRRWQVPEGLGLVFNRDSCVACHNGGAPGGGNNTILATRIGAITNGKFDPLIPFGGPVLQTQGITALQGRVIPGEVVPQQATIVARRRTTPTFGLGFVDAMPDAFFSMIAAKQLALTPETAGRPNMVMNLRSGRTVVGKFGWKAGTANLFDFSGEAFKEENGVTTPGWVRDADGRNISEENAPQGNVSLLQFNPAPNPNRRDLRDVQAFADFMTMLAPPPRGPITTAVTAGEKVFANIGCTACHSPTLTTGTHPISALSLKTFNPYSDFLLHDMGSLGDGMVQGIAKPTEMRTAPLWGLRNVTAYLHDGRATTLDDAILRHAGQGAPARSLFQRLNATDKANLIAFLKSL